jgi:hypothetical protein
MVFFQAERNLAYSRSGWSGAVSFGLSLTPDVDLAPRYADSLSVSPAGCGVEFPHHPPPVPSRVGWASQQAPRVEEQATHP